MKNNKELWVGIIASLAASFMLFIYAPLELYFNNVFEFWFDLPTLFPVLAELFGICAIVSIVVFALLHKFNRKLYRGFLVAYFIIYIASYIQGNYMVQNLPLLDGHKVDWSQYSAERWGSLILWFVVAGVIIVIYRKFHKETFGTIVKFVSVCVSLMLLVTLLSLCVMKNGTVKKNNYCLTYKNMMQMSEDRNLIVLVLDCVDSGAFDRVLENHPEYAEILEDFTYFDDAMSTYGFTEYSIPYIYGGEWYEYQGSVFDYGNNALNNSPLISRVKQMDYRMGLYSEDFPMTEECLLDYDNIVASNGKITSWKTFALNQLKFIGLRYAPFELKKYCIFDTNSFWELREVEGADQAFTMSNEKFYYTELEKEVTLTKDKVFKFIHIEGAHEPFQYDANMQRKENATYEDNIEASMAIVKKYLDKLKNAGVYDNSAIIILADHGWDANYDHWVSRQDSLLLVKGVEEKHPMQISSAPVSYTDLQEAYRRILEGKMSTELFDCKEGESRERRFLWYDPRETEGALYEYIQTGKADDESTFLPTGVIYEYAK